MVNTLEKYSGKNEKMIKEVFAISFQVRFQEYSYEEEREEAEKEVLVQTFVYSNFNYCSLVWYFSSSKSLQNIERIQERALRFLYNDHKSSYDDLLIRSRKCTMQVARQRTLRIEIFKTVKHLNPSFMQSVFSSRTSKHPSRNPNNLNHFRPNQVTFGSKSLKAIGPQIWNCLPNEIKSADNLNSFKRMIKQWDGPSCKCNACKYNHTL